jgi:hypothetical protein
MKLLFNLGVAVLPACRACRTCCKLDLHPSELPQRSNPPCQQVESLRSYTCTYNVQDLKTVATVYTEQVMEAAKVESRGRSMHYGAGWE